MARTNLKVTDGIAIDFYDDGNSNKGSIYLDNGAFVFSGTSGGDVVIGEVGNGADLVFEESSTIHGQGGNTLTFGQSGDSIVFAVDTTFNANIDSNGIIRLSADGSASNHFLSIGDGDDFKIYHDSNDTRIRNFTGNLVIANEGNDKDIIFQNDNNSGGMTDWIALDGSEFKTLFKVDTRHQDDIKQYWGSGNDTFAYYNSSTLDFEIQHSGDMFYITHSGGVGSNRKIAFNLRNQIVFQDRADGNAELFSFDMNARTMTVGKDNDGVSLNIYGDVAGEYTTLYRNYDFTAGSKTTLKLMTADQSVYIVGHRTAADAGSNLEFDVTNSSGVRVPGMIINEAADIRFHEGVYIGTGADSGNTDHIRLLGSSTLFNRNTEHQDGVYAYFGADADASLYHDDTDFHIQNTKGHLDIINSGSDIRLQSAGNVTIELDTNQDGNNYFRIMDGNDNTDFIVAENLATFPYTYGIRYYYDVTSNYDFTTAVTDDGITFSTASNTRDMIFKLGSSANTIFQLGDTQVTVGSTDNNIPLAISRYANTGTYDDLGVIQPAAASAGIGINYHNGTAFDLGFKLTKTGTVDLTQSKLTIAGATGTNGQVLTTDGAGNISWSTVSGGGSVDPAYRGASGFDETIYEMDLTGFANADVPHFVTSDGAYEEIDTNNYVIVDTSQASSISGSPAISDSKSLKFRRYTEPHSSIAWSMPMKEAAFNFTVEFDIKVSGSNWLRGTYLYFTGWFYDTTNDHISRKTIFYLRKHAEVLEVLGSTSAKTIAKASANNTWVRVKVDCEANNGGAGTNYGKLRASLSTSDTDSFGSTVNWNYTTDENHKFIPTMGFRLATSRGNSSSSYYDELWVDNLTVRTKEGQLL
jgi:hypothetical protein